MDNMFKVPGVRVEKKYIPSLLHSAEEKSIRMLKSWHSK